MTEQMNEITAMEGTNKRDSVTADTDNWGYAVCFGTIITFIAGIGHINSFGLIYNDFMKDTNSTTKSLTAAHGVFAIMLAVGGIILNLVTKKYTLRCGGFIGASLFIMGSFATIFITNTNQLPFTFGLLQGIGFGMMVPVCYSTINYYFIRKRTTIMSTCKAIQGAFMMMYPQFLKLTMGVYGFRGTLLLICGISLHMIPGMVVMKKQRQIDKKGTRIANNGDAKVSSHESVDLVSHHEQQDNKTKDIQPKIVTDNGVWAKVMEILNLKMLKDPIYCNICFGQSFMNFSDLTFFMLQPMLLFQYGYDKTQVATCISIAAGADVAGRILLAIISSFIFVDTKVIFYVSTLLTFIVRIGLLQVRQFVWVALVTAALGVLKAWLHVASPLVIASHVSQEDFPGAYALFMLCAGLINLLLGPLIGLLKDCYDDYIPAFYALILCCLPCLIFWPLLYKYYKKQLLKH